MLNKILASLTLILLLSLTASLVFWSDDAHPTMITDGVVVALVKVVVVLVIITTVRLCLSLFNGKKVPVSSGETATHSPRNVNLKYTYITIALSLIAPFILYLGTTLMWNASVLTTPALMNSPLWKYSYFYLDPWFDPIVLTLASLIFVGSYAFIAWSLKKMHTQMKAGEITTRAFAYPAIITGTPFVLLGVGLLGTAIGF
jgi:hypothetical protein